MANNQYVNKVEYAGQTLVDLTGDTATPSDVLNGVTFHDRSGTPQQGSMITHNVYDGLDSSSTDDALSANQGKQLNTQLSDFGTRIGVFQLYNKTSSGSGNSLTVPAGNNTMFLATILRRELSNNITYNGIALIRIVDNTAAINQRVDANGITGVAYADGYLTVSFAGYCNLSLIRMA